MNDDPAKGRFIAIQLVRIGGVIMALLGLLVISHRLDLPGPFGVVLFALGLFEALALPLILARRWRSGGR